MGIIPIIKLKVAGSEVNQVIEALSDLNTNAITQPQKTAVSILENVLVKFLKKQIAKRHDIDPFKLELAYYEAFYLKEYLLKYNTTMQRHYIQTMIDKLDQKLA